MTHQESLVVPTEGRSIVEISSAVSGAVARARVAVGLCSVFIQHTSASLFINENADPTVLIDLETFLRDLVRDGDPRFRHTAEGPDDMSAHIRSLLTRTALTIPVRGGALALGTWQGIYLWEHRSRPHRRKILVTVMGDAKGSP